MTLKTIYETRKAISSIEDIDALQNMLKNSGVQPTINSDRTIRIESSKGLDCIKDSIDSTLPMWADGVILPTPINLVYNVFPLSSTMCLLKL